MGYRKFMNFTKLPEHWPLQWMVLDEEIKTSFYSKPCNADLYFSSFC